MATEPSSSSASKAKSSRKRKPKKKKPSQYPKRSLDLPKNTVLRKTAIRRENLPPKYSAGPKIVYVSRKTPFISAVKRVRKHLSVFDKQAVSATLQKPQPSQAKGKGNQKLRVQVPKPIRPPKKNHAEKKEEKVVIIRATGRAIEKAMGLGLYFQGQDDVDVQLQTGTVECVDEVVVDTSKLGLQDLLKPGRLAQLKNDGGGGDGDMDVDEEVEDEGGGDKMDVESEEDEILDDEHPNRTRFTSMLEVIVRKKGI